MVRAQRIIVVIGRSISEASDMEREKTGNPKKMNIVGGLASSCPVFQYGGCRLWLYILGPRRLRRWLGMSFFP
jgi:hypothetical protein